MTHSHPVRLAARQWLALLLISLSVPVAVHSQPQLPDRAAGRTERSESVSQPPLLTSAASLGRRLYELGLDSNGKAITAIDESGVVYVGEQAACQRCHRRSGFGGSEGGYYVPPITAGFLFEASGNDRNERFRAAFLEAQNTRQWIRARMPRSRPAYTTETLATAIRHGRNPAGTEFDGLMPRYRITDEDIANLAAYLGGLSKNISAGVDEEYLHIATVVGPDIDRVERDAMLSTTSAFVEWYNERLRADLAHQASQRAYGMQLRSSTRLWKLHVWQLHGANWSWGEQLLRYHKEQPVFVMINGLVAGSWTPIAEFCDSQHLPCLFPLTELPDTSRKLGGYTLYYTRGLELEADVLGRHLAGLAKPPAQLTQIHHTSAAGSVPAARFARVVAERLPGTALRSIPFDDATGLQSALATFARGGESSDGVIVWPGEQRDAFKGLLRTIELATTPLYTCSSVIDVMSLAASDQHAVAARLTVTWPYALPTVRTADSYRARAWMRSRGILVTRERLQFMSYYSLGILRDSLRHMFEHFHGDYLIERVEHEVDGAQNPGFYPMLALGPEQRTLSKGGYVLRLSSGTALPASGWIVP